MERISINHLFISLVCLALCSCAIIRENNNRQKSITANQFKLQNGMSKDQVKELFGDPCNSQFSGQDEAWQYCYTGSVNSVATPNHPSTMNNHYIIVWFNNSIVTGMTSYDNISESLCTDYFKSIRWEDSPGRVIEIRNR